MEIVKAQNVTLEITNGEITATLLKDVNISIPKGKLVSIIGPSGSGKSTLLYLLGLLDNPTKGEIFIDGVNMTSASKAEQENCRLNKLGFIFQFHFLLSEFNVLENIMLPMLKKGIADEQEAEKKAMELTEYFNLSGLENKFPKQLSGGQRQRVAIARAMANNPTLLLADEPTGNLDTKNAKNVFDLFKKIVSEGDRTIIVVTHDQELASMCDYTINIVDGMVRG
ncbi:MAG: ABC transporter ATP-binding protein [Alphaproteobacteria bacterium]|nr:ABC transporter ATP-binding protein [Alphaproteobacteria bacterium]OJV11937.1 MAG: hypothetical protein BGO27_00530 [Alphaproteobacteria bacterium 33-17]